VLVLTRGVDEAIMIGHDVEVKVLEVRGDRVRIGIRAPAAVPVHRKEVYEAIQRENVEAARAAKVPAAVVGDLVRRLPRKEG
jgi:carbon storage regulator